MSLVPFSDSETRSDAMRSRGVKEGVGLVVHFPLEDVAKINTP